MKKFILVIASALALGTGAFAQEQHFKWYGFIRTYFDYDSRESYAGTEDLFYYMPKDEKINAAGVDENAVSSFRFAAITSRLGLDVVGYEFGGYKFGAKIETDFYSGVSGVTGTATLRLRQAFATASRGGRFWKIGQAWHPMAADLPDVFSLDSGLPFQPFSRTPQVAFDWQFTEHWSLNTAAIWQMQYTSVGPNGAKADYIKYSCTPEIYLGTTLKSGNTIVKLAADFLSIRPRNINSLGQKAKERMNTYNLFLYAQGKCGNVNLKTKLVYANDGCHMNLVGGYGVSAISADDNWTFSASRNLSWWGTASYKKKDCRWNPQILFGYIKCFGTKDAIIGQFWTKDNTKAGAFNQMWRIQPEVLYNIGKFALGAEYMVTGVQYGNADEFKRVKENLHNVVNHRVQLMVKYTF